MTIEHDDWTIERKFIQIAVMADWHSPAIIALAHDGTIWALPVLRAQNPAELQEWTRIKPLPDEHRFVHYPKPESKPVAPTPPKEPV